MTEGDAPFPGKNPENLLTARPAGYADAVPTAVRPEEAERLAAELAVLAEPHRLLVLSELQTGPRSAGALAKSIGMAPSLASHHLAVLLRADLVSRWREGSYVFYTLNRKRVVELNQSLGRLARPPAGRTNNRVVPRAAETDDEVAM